MAGAVRVGALVRRATAEQFRAIFAPGGEERILTLDEWLICAARSRIPEFVDLARRIGPYRDDIAATLT